MAAASLVKPATGAPEAAGVFEVSERQSAVVIHVGRSGIFSFAGHLHDVDAPVGGSITADPDNLQASSVRLTFAAARFHVLPEGEPPGDAPKVEEVMRGPRVLDTARFADVQFRSHSVTGREVGRTNTYEVQVTGDVTIHGVSREVVVPMTVSFEGNTLRARGRGTIRHDQFGLTPVAVAAGTVRVRNEIDIDFDIVADRRD